MLSTINYEREKLMEFVDMNDCTKFSCYHCHRKTCLVLDRAKERMRRDQKPIIQSPLRSENNG